MGSKKHRTFASAFEKNRELQRKRSLKSLHEQVIVVQDKRLYNKTLRSYVCTTGTKATVFQFCPALCRAMEKGTLNKDTERPTVSRHVVYLILYI